MSIVALLSPESAWALPGGAGALFSNLWRVGVYLAGPGPRVLTPGWLGRRVLSRPIPGGEGTVGYHRAPDSPITLKKDEVAQ